MLGDDLNATVMTERVGFGTGFVRAREGVLCTVHRDSGLARGKNEEQAWSRNGQRKQGGTRQLRADASFQKQ